MSAALPWPLGWHENSLPGDGLIARLAALDEAGVDWIELDGWRYDADPNGTLAALRHYPKIRVAAVCGGLGTPLLAGSPEGRRRALDDLARLIRRTRDAGATRLVTAPLLGPARLPDLWPLKSSYDVEFELAVALLQQAAPWAEAIGVDVVLEPINRYRTHFIHRLDQATALCAAVGSPRIKAMADTFHMHIEERAPAAALQAAGAQLGHVHLADSDRRHPGSGHLDFAPLLAALQAIKYEGPLVVECAPPDDFAAAVGATRERLEAAAEAARAVEAARAADATRAAEVADPSPFASDPETGRFRPGPDPLLSPAQAAAPPAHLLDLLDDAGRAENVAELRAVVRALIERLWTSERD